MHKFLLMFAILATISMSSLAHAQEPSGQRGERGQRGEAGQRGGGGQRGGAGQRGGGGQRGGAERGQRPLSPMMTALDTDKDGTLSSKEIANAATALKTLDKNEDGVLDATELAPPRGQNGRGDADAMVKRVMERDTDKDGKVSKEEAGDRMGRIFDRMDEDSDGFVTKTEIEKMAQQFQRGGGGGGGGRGAGGGRNQPSTKKERPAFDE
ncbi:hypothetical protein N9Y42_02425 [Mariniblastus sp.]|nr:hypothetical protein [Mariniblastus sp.]